MTRMRTQSPFVGETHARFRDLTARQKEEARARFSDAGPNDARVYVIDSHGELFARKLGRHPEPKRSR